MTAGVHSAVVRRGALTIYDENCERNDYRRTSPVLPDQRRYPR